MAVYLKSIGLNGFKSFAGKTEIRFIDGVTGIVGPNGCGKSNVVEAIKWVLGEQSPKSLRGEKMQDVIFNGTRDRSATGMAEVTLTFNNENRWLPVEFADVEVGRRIFRSGEGQYSLNKTRVRLRDMLEMFMDTGIGRDSYAIFEQGKIDRLLSEKPIERRVLFEDFAGISLFKFRKEDAERKLANSQLNLDRVQDMIVQLEKEVSSLKSQAEDANRYNVVREELTKLEIKFEALRAHKIQNEIDKREERKNKQNERLAPFIESLREKENSLQTIDQDILNREGEFAQVNQVYNNLEREFTEVNSNVKNSLEQQTGQENRLASLDVRLQQEQKHLTSLEEELDVKEKDFETVSANKTNMDEILAGIQAKIGDVNSLIQNVNNKILNRSNEIGYNHIISKDDIAKIRNDVIALQTRQEEYRKNLKERWEIFRNYEKEQTEKQNQQDNVNTALTEILARLEEVKTNIDNLIDREKGIKAENLEYSEEIKKLQVELKSMDKVIMESIEKQSLELKNFSAKKPLLEAKIESAVNKLALSIEQQSSPTETKEILENLKNIFNDYKNHYEEILGILYSDEGTYTRKENVQNRIEELTDFIYNNEHVLEGLRNNKSELQERRTDISGDYRRTEFELGSIKKEITKLNNQIENTQSNMKILENQINANTEKINNKQTLIEQMETIVADYEKEVEDLRTERNTHSEELQDKKLSFARSDEQYKSMRSEIERIKQQVKDIRRTIEGYENEKHSVLETIDILRARIEENASKIDELQNKIDNSKDDIEKRKEEITGLKGARKMLELQIREGAANAQKIENEIIVLETSIEDRKINLTNIVENARSTFSLDISKEKINDEDDHIEIAKHTKNLRSELSRLGDVNLLAIEQFQDAKERMEYLAAQKADIETAMKDIVAIIDETNAKSTEKFIEAFEQIRKAFKKFFVRLFDGGKADLVLTDKNDILNSGVEILAQPPGKKLQSVSLMSGGEKALVAIAMVFAILYLKPTPFVVLDELDAPLDDDNIERFKKLLLDFKETSQFIVVSHSKSTLEICDTLYGVTMEELGVSKIINVAFDEANLLLEETDPIVTGK